MEENTFIYVDEETLQKVDEKMPPEEELQDLAASERERYGQIIKSRNIQTN